MSARWRAASCRHPNPSPSPSPNQVQAAGPNPNPNNDPNPNQVQAAGGDSKALLAGFEAYAATQPQQRGAQDDEPP